MHASIAASLWMLNSIFPCVSFNFTYPGTEYIMASRGCRLQSAIVTCQRRLLLAISSSSIFETWELSKEKYSPAHWGMWMEWFRSKQGRIHGISVTYSWDGGSNLF